MLACQRCDKIGHFSIVCSQGLTQAGKKQMKWPKINTREGRVYNSWNSIPPDSPSPNCQYPSDYQQYILPHSGRDITYVQQDQTLSTNLAKQWLTSTPCRKLLKVHFYLSGRDASGVVKSLHTAKQLRILQESYSQLASVLHRFNVPITAEQPMAEFPTVYDDRIRTIPDEKFHILLQDNAHPFCVTTSCTVPWLVQRNYRIS